MSRPNSSASLDGRGEEWGRVSDHSTPSGNNLGFGIAEDLGQLGWIHFMAGLSLPPPRLPWQQVCQPAAAPQSPQQLFIEGNSQLY